MGEDELSELGSSFVSVFDKLKKEREVTGNEVRMVSSAYL